MSSVKTLFGLVRHFSNTIHALQQERGASAGFISSNGEKFHNKLRKIRKKSDEQIQTLLFYFNLNASSLQQYFNEEEYATLNTKFNHLYLLRENIDDLTIEFSKSYSKYTQHIASLLLNIADISDKVDNKKIRDGLYVYSTLLMYKESIGQKRAALSSLFSKNDFLPELFEYYLTADTQEKIYLKTFKHAANMRTIDFYDNAMNNDLLLKIKAYEKLGIDKLRGKEVEVNPEKFFEDISKKINEVQKVEIKLAQKIMDDIDTLQRDDPHDPSITTPYKVIPLSKLYFFNMFPLTPSQAMVAKIDAGFKKVSKSKLEAIEKKWMPLSSHYYSNTIFTKEELAWIQKHKTIRVGVEKDLAPFEFINAKGQFDGYVKDYLNEIEKLSGLKLELETNSIWATLMQDFKKKKLDVLAMIYYTAERETFMNFSLHYLQVSDYIYVNKKNQNISSLKEFKGKSIAVVKGYMIGSWLKKNYPDITIIEKNNILDALIAVDTQKADGFIGDNTSTAYTINENYLKNVKLVADLKEKEPEKVYMGIRKDSPILVSIINKALRNISNEKMLKIQKKWSKQIDNVLNKSKLNMAVGYNKPPFMFGETSKKGIELNLVTQILHKAGYEIGDIEQMSFNQVNHVLLRNKHMDVAITVSKKENDGLYYSEPFIHFENVAITRKKDKLSIYSADDLLDKKVVSWMGANKVLTPRFNALFDAESPVRTEKYIEVADQTEQHRLFFTGQADVIVVDKTIFAWHKHNMKDSFDLHTEFEFHDIFPQKTYYYVAFKDKKIRDAFNKTLKIVKNEGLYEKVYKHFVEGNIKLQLEFANLIADISAPYIFHEKKEALEKIIKIFLTSMPSLNTIDVINKNDNSLFLHVTKKTDKEEKIAEVERESYYRGSGTPLKVGSVKLKFDYEEVKDLQKDSLPYLSSFDFLNKRGHKNIEAMYIRHHFIDNKIELSEEEKIWIKLHPVIKFTGDPDWLPFEAFNEKGKYIGIVAEYLDKLESLTGITFTRIPTKSWVESIALSESREIDIISESTVSSRKGLLFTKPYITNDIVIVMNKEHRYVEGLATIKNRKIALIKDYGYIYQIKQKFPNIDFVIVNTVSEGLSAVSIGKVDALLCTFALGSYKITKLGLSNIKIVGKTEFSSTLGLGVRED